MNPQEYIENILKNNSEEISQDEIAELINQLHWFTLEIENRELGEKIEQFKDMSQIVGILMTRKRMLG